MLLKTLHLFTLYIHPLLLRKGILLAEEEAEEEAEKDEEKEEIFMAFVRQFSIFLIRSFLPRSASIFPQSS